MIKTQSTYADPELAEISKQRWFQLIGIPEKQNVLYEDFYRNHPSNNLDTSPSSSKPESKGSVERVPANNTSN